MFILNPTIKLIGVLWTLGCLGAHSNMEKTKLKEKTIKINKIKFYIACFMNPSFPHYKPEKEALQRS